MIKFKLTCPDCRGTIITSFPQAIMWELCPSCKRHIWDGYDALMAEVYIANRKPGRLRHFYMNN